MFPCNTPEDSFLSLYPQHSTTVSFENSKSLRQEEILTTKIAEKMGVTSIYLIQPAFCFLNGLQPFIMSTLGKSPNGNERGHDPYLIQQAAAKITFLAWMNSCEPPLPQPPGEGRRSFLKVFLPCG